MSSVLDSSALLALILREPGMGVVSEAIDQGGFVSTVNLCEVVSRLQDLGNPEVQTRALVQDLMIQIVNLDADTAWRAGLLRRVTRSKGLSLGDRVCLALAASMQLPAMTADRNWAGLDVGVEVVLCR